MLRRVALTLAYALCAFVLALLMLALHLPSRPGRRAARDIANRVLTGLFKGRIVVGQVDRIGWRGPLVVSGVRVVDPYGRTIIAGARVRAESAEALVRALRQGTPMPALSAHAEVLRLYPSAEGGVSITETFSPRRHPPAHTATKPPALGPAYTFPRLVVSVDRIENHLAGVDAVGTNVRAVGRLVTEPLRFDARTAAPALVHIERLPSLSVQLSFDLASRLAPRVPGGAIEELGRMRLEALATGEGLSCHVVYQRVAGETSVRSEGCRASDAVLSRLFEREIVAGIALASFEARQPPEGPWQISLRGAIADQPLELEARFSPDLRDARADVRVRGMDLSRISPSLPATALTGALHAERHGEIVMANTEALAGRVRGVEVPGARARARIRGTTLSIEQIVVPSVGLIAQGELDLRADGPRARGVVELDTAEVGRLPLVPAGIHGALHVHAEGEYGAGGNARATFDALVRGLRSPSARVRQGHVSGTFTLAQGRAHLEANVRARGVVSGGVGPVDLRGHLVGDPTRSLEGNLVAEGDEVLPGPRGLEPTSSNVIEPEGRGEERTDTPRGRPTRIDARFRADIGPGSVRVTVPRAPVRIRGAGGHVAAEVTIPRGRGRVSGRARIEVEGGEAELRFAGARVTGTFRRFPVGWAARVAGLPFPLEGTIEGDLDVLTQRMGRTHGTLTWTDGRLPYLGEFDLRVAVDHRGEVSEYSAELAFGASRRDPDLSQRHRMVLHARAMPPEHLHDVSAWVRGLREADAVATNVPLDVLQPLLPEMVRISGRADARIDVSRPEPGAEPRAVFGFDIRAARLTGQVPSTGTRLVRRILRGARAERVANLTDPMRLRGAVCARIAVSDLSRVPVEIATALGREVENPPVIVPPPNHCVPAAVEVPERLARVWGSLAGPWHRAAATAFEEYSTSHAGRLRDVRLSRSARGLLAQSPVDLSLEVGPIDSRRWPFNPALGTFVPALAPPSLPGVGEAAVHVQGPMLRPSLHARGRVHTSGVEALVARDELDLDASLVLVPREGESIMGVVDIRANALVRLTTRTARGVEPGGSATAELIARGPFAAVIDSDQGARAIEVARLELRTTEFRLGRLRWARGHDLDGRLTLVATGTPDPHVLVTANATVSDLRVRNQRAMAASFNAFLRNIAGQWEIDACSVVGPSRLAAGCNPDERGTEAAVAPEGGARLDIALPLSGDVLQVTPARSEAGERTASVTLPLLGVFGFRPRVSELDASLLARGFRLETVSPFVETPPIVRIGGALSGSLDWSARAPRSFSGEVTIRDGLLDIERIGEPARDVTLELIGSGRRVGIERVAFRLGTGTFSGRGQADFSPASDGRIARVDLRATTRELPLIQEGNTYGYLTAEIDYRGTFFSRRHEGRARIGHADIRVPAQPSRQLQALDANPNVFIIGESRPSSGGRTDVYVFEVRYETTEPVLVRRDDFLVALRSDGLVHYDAAGVAVTGEIEQARQQAWFDLFGKRFYFDRLNIFMDGAIDFNPLLDIALHYDSPSAGRIGLFVTDRLDSPRVTLSAERYPGASQSEILALLIFGRPDSRGASDQAVLAQQTQQAAASLLTGLFLNTLSSGVTAITRGMDLVPTLIAEPGETSPLGGRYGFGVTAGRFYLQGTYGAVGAYTGGGQVVADPSAARAQEFRAYGEYNATEAITISGYGGSSARFGAQIFFTPSLPSGSPIERRRDQRRR